MTSVTVTRGSFCTVASASSSAVVARLPSRPSTAHSAADGPRPASRDRSLAASGSAARTRTPPGAPSMVVTWPGITRAAGVASSATAARTVVARSDALMPVETPCRASMEAPYAGSGRVGSADINGMPSCRMRSRGSTRQTRPRPCVTMKLMTSGVTRAALHASTASGGSLALSTISRSPPARSCSRHSGLRSAFTGGRVPRDPTRGKGPSGFTRPAVPEPRRRDPARRARRRRRRAGSRP